jgi:hypothetical protein
MTQLACGHYMGVVVYGSDGQQQVLAERYDASRPSLANK